VRVELDDRAFAYFRPEAKHWLVEAGGFTITVGFSAADAGALRGSVSRSTALMLPV
jgi:beta-glucosidase